MTTKVDFTTAPAPAPAAVSASVETPPRARAAPAPPENQERPSRRWDRGSYRTKLVAWICALVLVTGSAITAVALSNHRATATMLAGELFHEVSDHGVTLARTHLLHAVPLIESLKHMAGDGLDLDDSDHLARQLVAILDANPGVTWISYANEAGTFTGAYRTPNGRLRVNQSRIENGFTRLVEHDVHEDGSWAVYRRLDDNGYDPRERPFYIRARETRRPVWLPPYVFFDQGVTGITCANPVYADNNTLRGVLTVDYDLNTLSKFLGELRISANSRFFLFAQDGTLLANPGAHVAPRIGRGTEGNALTLDNTGDPLLKEYHRRLPEVPTTKGDNPTFRQFDLQVDGRDYMASATGFAVDDGVIWFLGAVAPESDFLSGVWKAQNALVLISGLALLIAVLLSIAMADRVSGPLMSLIGLMRQVGDGDLKARARIGGSREFAELSAALNRMIDDLRDRLRMRHSLSVATDIQQRLLPAVPPTVPGLDIAGRCISCDETGGDYYDFITFENEPTRLMVAVGDVTGHGVGAALVMAGARAVLRDRVNCSDELGRSLDRVNELLRRDLRGQRFMTMGLTMIDGHSRTFRWSSAGHGPPLIYDAENDAFVEVEGGDIPLGIEDCAYSDLTGGPLPAGTIFAMVTDGLWETRNLLHDMYGKQRLRELLRANAHRPAEAIASAIITEVDQFRERAKPDDDVTLVIVKLV